MAEKMDIFIYLPLDTKTQVPKYEQKIYNSHGDHLATLRSVITTEFEAPIPAYLFFTKPLEGLFPVDKEYKMESKKYIIFK